MVGCLSDFCSHGQVFHFFHPGGGGEEGVELADDVRFRREKKDVIASRMLTEMQNRKVSLSRMPFLTRLPVHGLQV